MRAALTRLLLLGASVPLLLTGCGASSPVPAASGPPAPQPPDPAATRAAATTSADPALIASRSTVPVLCFHQIRDWRRSDSRADRAIITPPTVFAAQMDTLARSGFVPITDDDLYAHLTTGAPLPPKPILLTFDDGSESQVQNAVPILEQHRFPATFFPMTVVLDKRMWITTDQIRRLQASGFTIGSHTYDHEPVSGYHDADFQRQLVAPRRELSAIVGRPVADFAFPYGDWRRSSLPHVAAAGYRMAFGLDTPADPAQPLLSYPRVIVSPTWTTGEFLAAIAKAPHPNTNGAAAGGE
jgi:peptidoglycan/xylan/chitin deacetylase (PgdA/CDA1 family)